MKTNVGRTDKILRIALAIILFVVWIAKGITGTLGIIALLVAVILLATSYMRFCPLYSILGISTCPINRK
ncbi:MAG: DUF2892 domain-containing protein [Microscillaceae bacterium]|nr:DUF2892 domain-containing protein [Microscillaceae bacterium]MDW8459882.1 DUF2892 domain-containing protein [Cytophagales bacterium]